MAAEVVVRRKPIIIGVMGSHREEEKHIAEQARRIGQAIAERGCVLLTGGGPGLMRAASAGASQAGGLVLGILPHERGRFLPGYPNEYVDIPIYTGLSEGRNVINAKTSNLLIALPGGFGTLSEIALALKTGTPVIGLGCPEGNFSKTDKFIKVATPEEAIAEMDVFLRKWHDAGKSGFPPDLPLA